MIRILFIGIIIKSVFIFLNIFYFVDVIFVLTFIKNTKENNFLKIISLGLIQDLLFESYVGLNVFIYLLCFLFNGWFEKNFNINNRIIKILNYFILILIKTFTLYIFYNLYIEIDTFNLLFNIAIYFILFFCFDLVIKSNEKK